MTANREISEDHSPNIESSNDYDRLMNFYNEVYSENLTFWQKKHIKYFGGKVKRYITKIEVDGYVILKTKNDIYRWKM